MPQLEGPTTENTQLCTGEIWGGKKQEKKSLCTTDVVKNKRKGQDSFKCLSQFWHSFFLKTKSSETHVLVLGVCLPEQCSEVVYSPVGVSPLSDRGFHSNPHKLEMCLFFPFYSFLMCGLQPFSCLLSSLVPGAPHTTCPSIHQYQKTHFPKTLFILSPSCLSNQLWAHVLSIPESPLPCLPVKTRFPFLSNVDPVFQLSYTYIPPALYPCSFSTWNL